MKIGLKSVIAVWMFTFAGQSLAQSFSFDEDPTSGGASTRISLPEKQGTPLGLAGKTLINGNIGEVRYTYTIDLPAWRGLLNAFTLSYSSQNGYGIWGQGFSDSIPYIERSKQFGVPKLASPFVHSQVGELTAVGKDEYRARVEGSFQRYSFEGGHFKVYDGKGKILIYGESEGGREAEGDFTSRWMLERIIDPAGHSVHFYYGKVEGSAQAFIQKIAFVEKSGQISYAAEFTYEPLTRPVINYYSGVKKAIPQRVASVGSYWIEQSLDERSIATANLAADFHDRRVRMTRLKYQELGVTSRSLPVSIQGFGRSDQDIAPATALHYSQPCLDPQSECKSEISFQSNTVMPGQSFGSKTSRLLDINSDGLLDIISSSDETDIPVWSAAFNMGVAADETWAGVGAKVRSPLQGISFAAKDRLLMDLNGDRKVDFLIEDQAYLNQGGDSPLWTAEATPVSGLPRGLLNNPILGAWIDINGDSRADYISYVDDDSNSGSVLSLDIYWNQSQGKSLSFSAPLRFKIENAPRFSSQRIDWTDLNGDSLPDLVLFTPDTEDGAKQIRVWTNRGDGRFVNRSTLTLDGYKEKRIPRWFDINGDGYSDAVIISQGAPSRIFLHNGQDRFEKLTASLSDEILSKATLFEFGDINANGSRDLVVGHSGNRLAVFDPYANSETSAPFLLTRVTTSLGESNIYQYGSSSRYTANDRLGDRPPVSYQIAKYWRQFAPSSTKAKTFRNRLISQTDYKFRLAAYDALRNEFLGFKFVDQFAYQQSDANDQTALQSRGLRRSLEYYTTENSGLLKGKTKHFTEFRLSDGAMTSESRYDFGIYDLIPDKAVYLPVLKEETSRKFEGSDAIENRTIYCTKYYKSTFLPAQKTKTEFLNGAAYRMSLTNYQAAGDEWLVNIPRRQMLFDSASNQILLGKAYHFNRDVCKLERVDRFEGNDEWNPIQKYDYDERGNLIRSTDAEGHSVHAKYEGPGNFRMSSTEESAGEGSPVLSKHVVYDYRANGQPAELTDENGKVWKIVYDGLARMKEWLVPGATEATYSFDYAFGDLQTPSTVYTKKKGQRIGGTQYFDGLMKPFASTLASEKGFILENWVASDLQGNTEISYLPLAQSSQDWKEWKLNDSVARRFSYDEQNRATEREVPGFKGRRHRYVSSYAIQNNQLEMTSLDPNQERRVIAIDALGRTTQVREAAQIGNEEVDAVYKVTSDALNRITALDIPEKASRAYSYNSIGQLTRIQSDDNGIIEIEYSPNNNIVGKRFLTTQKQPLMSSFYDYDELGRINEVRFADKRAESKTEGWERAKQAALLYYDEAPDESPDLKNTLGRQTSLQLFPGAQYFYSYDDGGNKISETLKLYDKVINTETVFDETGRLSTLKYPDGQTLNYLYNETTSLVSGIENVIPSIERDSLNRVLSYSVRDLSFDSDLVIRHSFEEISGFPTRLSMAGAVTLLDHQYDDFDSVGRITRLSGVDQVEGSFQKSFAYDKRGQLVQADIDIKGKGDAPIKQLLDFEYSLAGDIKRLGDKTLSYKFAENKSLRSIDSSQDEHWEFDSFSRIKSSSKLQSIGWGPDFSLACVNAESGSSRYSYFPDGTRFSEVIRSHGKIESTAFVNRFVHYHKESDSFTKYYWIDNERFAVQRQNKFEAVLHDRIQSGRVTVEKGKTTSSYYDYRPYGEKLKSLETVPERPYRFQFAGQLADVTGLYQMGTRAYDPSLGRFAVADLSFLGAPDKCLMSPVDCNLSVYAGNDPVNQIDDSGKNPVAIATFAINFTISATITTLVEMNKAEKAGKVVDVWDVTKKAAFSGALNGATSVLTLNSGMAYKAGVSLGSAIIEKTADIIRDGRGPQMSDIGDVGLSVAADLTMGAAGDFLRPGKAGLEDAGRAIADDFIKIAAHDGISRSHASEVAKSLMPANFGLNTSIDAAVATIVGGAKAVTTPTVEDLQNFFKPNTSVDAVPDSIGSSSQAVGSPSVEMGGEVMEMKNGDGPIETVPATASDVSKTGP